jgi:hypothetical protein
MGMGLVQTMEISTVGRGRGRPYLHGIFQVGELVLLRRRHSFDPCKTVNVFGLKN